MSAAKEVPTQARHLQCVLLEIKTTQFETVGWEIAAARAISVLGFFEHFVVQVA